MLLVHGVSGARAPRAPVITPVVTARARATAKESVNSRKRSMGRKIVNNISRLVALLAVLGLVFAAGMRYQMAFEAGVPDSLTTGEKKVRSLRVPTTLNVNSNSSTKVLGSFATYWYAKSAKERKRKNDTNVNKQLRANHVPSITPIEARPVAVVEKSTRTNVPSWCQNQDTNWRVTKFSQLWLQDFVQEQITEKDFHFRTWSCDDLMQLENQFIKWVEQNVSAGTIIYYYQKEGVRDTICRKAHGISSHDPERITQPADAVCPGVCSSECTGNVTRWHRWYRGSGRAGS